MIFALVDIFCRSNSRIQNTAIASGLKITYPTFPKSGQLSSFWIWRFHQNNHFHGWNLWFRIILVGKTFPYRNMWPLDRPGLLMGLLQDGCLRLSPVGLLEPLLSYLRTVNLRLLLRHFIYRWIAKTERNSSPFDWRPMPRLSTTKYIPDSLCCHSSQTGCEIQISL